MPTIPASINGVAIQLAPGVNPEVSQRMIDALTYTVSLELASEHSLRAIYISSAYDSHRMPSRHMQRKAVDISRLNGTRIALGYPHNGEVKAAVGALQQRFEAFESRRENFGPHLKRKLGQNWTVAGHHDHIHFSVD